MENEEILYRYYRWLADCDYTALIDEIIFLMDNVDPQLKANTIHDIMENKEDWIGFGEE